MKDFIDRMKKEQDDLDMKIAKIERRIIQVPISMPEMPPIATAPKYRIDIKLTTMYNINQNIAIIIATVPLYR